MGREPEALAALQTLGVTGQVVLGSSSEDIGGNLAVAMNGEPVDVVLDDLWVASASAILQTLSGRGSPSGEPRVRYVQIADL